jgi:hypothetical protein
MQSSLASRNVSNAIQVTLRWGGWDLNPGPADYETSAHLGIDTVTHLPQRHKLRCWLPPFGRVFATIKHRKRPSRPARCA